MRAETPSLPDRKRRTLVALIVLVTLGFSYQFRYDLKRARIERAVRGFYLKYFSNPQPDEAGVAHWTRWAQDRWGLAKVERLGFAEQAAKEKARAAR